MQVTDDELVNFEANGAAPLPASGRQGFVENDGARIWYAAYGSGPAVILDRTFCRLFPRCRTQPMPDAPPKT